MTSTIFEQWMKEFNTKMTKQNRNIILLLDNTPCHWNSTVQTSLLNFNVKQVNIIYHWWKEWFTNFFSYALQMFNVHSMYNMTYIKFHSLCSIFLIPPTLTDATTEMRRRIELWEIPFTAHTMINIYSELFFNSHSKGIWKSSN